MLPSLLFHENLLAQILCLKLNPKGPNIQKNLSDLGPTRATRCPFPPPPPPPPGNSVQLHRDPQRMEYALTCVCTYGIGVCVCTYVEICNVLLEMQYTEIHIHIYRYTTDFPLYGADTPKGHLTPRVGSLASLQSGTPRQTAPDHRPAQIQPSKFRLGVSHNSRAVDGCEIRRIAPKEPMELKPERRLALTLQHRSRPIPQLSQAVLAQEGA